MCYPLCLTVMSLFGKVTICFASLCFVAFVAFAARPSNVTQLLCILVTPGFLIFSLISLVRLCRHQGREHWRIILPPATCVLAVALAMVVVRPIRLAVFHRWLPHYESVIRQMESGTISVTHELRRISQVEGGPAYAVLAQRTNGVLTVEFLTGGGFPVKHSGYLYSSSGSIEPGSIADRRWPRRREVKPLWFQISD